MLADKEYRVVVFQSWKEQQRHTAELAAAYGRWLVASIVVIHAGALFSMFSFLSGYADTPTVITGYAAPVWCFVAGLVLALMAGLTTWLNWSLHSASFAHQANFKMLVNPEEWLNDGIHKRGIWWTYWLSLLFGIASATLIPIAAALILYGINVQSPTGWIV